MAPGLWESIFGFDLFDPNLGHLYKGGSMDKKYSEEMENTACEREIGRVRIGDILIVYDRYLFALPVKGVVMGKSTHDGSIQINFHPFKDTNHGGINTLAYSGKYFHPEQCRRLDGSPLLDESFEPKRVNAVKNPDTPDILSGAEDERLDPLQGNLIGYIPFAYHLVPPRGFAKVAAVMRCGERKGRSPNEWRQVPIAEHINHAISHLQAYLAGRSGHSHLANAGCRVLMALDLDRRERLPEPVYDPRLKVEDPYP